MVVCVAGDSANALAFVGPAKELSFRAFQDAEAAALAVKASPFV